MGTTPAMDLSDPAVFARLYDEHAAAVYGSALRVLGNPATAQDVAQDVFLRLWRRPGAFDARRGDLAASLRLFVRGPGLARVGSAAGGRRAAGRRAVVPRVRRGGRRGRGPLRGGPRKVRSRSARSGRRGPAGPARRARRG